MDVAKTKGGHVTVSRQRKAVFEMENGHLDDLRVVARAILEATDIPDEATVVMGWRRIEVMWNASC